MQKALEISKKIIASHSEDNALVILEEINLHITFREIYRLNVTLSKANLIVAFIIMAYDPDSGWIDIRKDRYENKCTILKSLNCDISDPIFQSILQNENEKVNNVILTYLIDLTDWRWHTIYTLLDYHSNIIRFVNQKTATEKSTDVLNKEMEKQTLVEEYDVDVIAKVSKQKGELLEQAIQKRKKADELLSEIKKDFVSSDVAVQADFGFSYTDTAKKKVDIMSWRSYIKDKNERKKAIS